MKRLYLDALIESYIAVSHRGGDVVKDGDKYTFRACTDAYQTVRDEIERLCQVQRDLGYHDYFERAAQ